MKKLSTTLSLVLSVVLMVTSITFTPAKAETIEKKQFQFSQMMETKKEYTSDYYYSDTYFAEDSYIYNPHLATMSMCAACASSGNTMSDPVWSGLSKDIEDLLTATGFDTIFVNEDFNKEPTKDSIGFVFAKKAINVNDKDYTLIAVNLRNANYGKEWFSNVNVGPDKIHAGFSDAADKVHTALNSYVRTNQIDGDVKIWISGYSRGAAVSNLLAKRLDDDELISRVSLEASDIYTYTFATPTVTAETDFKKPIYKNIFNTVSKYDVVPQVVPEQWNWHRYGEDIYLPSKTDSDYAFKKARAQKFLDLFAEDENITYDTLPGYKLDYTDKIEILPTKDQDVESTIDSLVTALTGAIESSENFNSVRPAVDAVLDVLYDATDEQKTAFFNSLKAKVTDPDFNVLSLIFNIMGDGDQAVDLLCDCLDEAGIPLEDPDVQKPALKQLIKYITTAVTNDIVGTTTAGLTIANSAMPFISNHYNCKYLAWMQSLDSNYKLDPEPTTEVPTSETQVPTTVVPTSETQIPTTVAPTVLPDPVPVVKIPDKVKVKKAIKKKSAKKLKITIKRIAGATGYQVQVSKKKKGKVLVKKYTKKIKFAIKSKKFKKAKKLYIKARAYVLDGNEKLFGQWSKAKKVKIK